MACDDLWRLHSLVSPDCVYLVLPGVPWLLFDLYRDGIGTFSMHGEARSIHLPW
jgi:hypothetical protein